MIWTIARRELVTRARSKGFRIVTAIMFLGVIALALFQSVIFSGDDTRDVEIGLIGPAAQWSEGLEAGTEDLRVTVVVSETSSAEDLARDDVDVAFDGTTLTWPDAPDEDLDLFIRETVQRETVTTRLQNSGLDQSEMNALFAPVEIAEVRLDGGDDELGLRLVVAGATGFAIFMLLQVWGSFLMMGVIEEKSSRVVEVLLSHVRPTTLLTGKILGLGILALSQMLIIVLGLGLGLAVLDDITIPAGVWAAVPVSLATFVLGFGFYASAFAAVGSMISRQEDATAAQMPVILPLIAGYFVAAASLSEPDNLAVTVGSFVPFTSPVLLPFRTAAVDVPAWQVALSLAILAASIWVMLELAGRIYRFSLLRIGRRVTWGEAWRSRRESAV